MKRYSIYFIVSFFFLNTAVIAQDGEKAVSPMQLPGMQGFDANQSAEDKNELDDVLFSPDELSDILNETEVKDSKKSAQPAVEKKKKPALPVKQVKPVKQAEPVREEDPDALSEKILERILKGLEGEEQKEYTFPTFDEPAKKPKKKVSKQETVGKPKTADTEKKTITPVVSDAEILDIESLDIDSPDEEIDEEIFVPVMKEAEKEKTVKPSWKPVVAKPMKKPKKLSKKKPASVQTVSKRMPDSSSYSEDYFKKGVTLYARRELRKAIPAFQRALDENEEDAESYYMLADIYFQLYDYENAWKNIQTAVGLNGGKINPLYTAIEKEVAQQYPLPGKVTLTFMGAICMFFAGTVWFLYKRKGGDILARGEIENLKKEIEILKMKNDIQDPRVRYYRALEACENGSTLLALNNLRSAEDEFMTAVVLYPQTVNAYLGLGYIHFLQKKYESAIRDYSKALEVDPNSATAYYGIGRALGEKGDKTAQLEKIQMATKLDPGFHEAAESLQYLQHSRKN